MNRLQARALLRERGLAAKKSFGQNFLVVEAVLGRIADACVPAADAGHARVVEIGAGLGALTEALLARAAHVVAIERDRNLVPLLAEAFTESVASGKLTLVEADAQQVDFRALLGERVDGAARVLAGNLPYNVTGRLLEIAVRLAAEVERVVFMVQEEVADRLLAAPGTKEYGALTVFVRAAYDVERALRVSPGSFYPSPDVTSSVVVLTPVRPPRAEETDAFRALVKAAFGMRRKTLRNAWRALFESPEAITRVALACGVSLDARGETLDVEDFARVARAMRA